MYSRFTIAPSCSPMTPVLSSTGSINSVELLARGIQSDSLLDQYMALRTVADATAGKSHFAPLHRTVEHAIAQLVEGGDPHIDNSLTTALRTSELEAPDVIGRYHRYLELTGDTTPKRVISPLFSTTPPQFRDAFVSLQADTAELNPIGCFLEALGSTKINPRIPDIAFSEFEDATPYLIENPAGTKSRGELQTRTAQLFGKSISLEELIAAFHVDVKGYRLGRLELKIFEHASLEIRGFIQADTGAEIGHFTRTIPAKPQDGSSWVARSNGVQIKGDHLQDQGIGRHLTQRLLAFLHGFGVDALEFPVDQAGTYVFPRLGFDFATPQIRDAIKIRFREYLRRAGFKLTESQEKKWLQLRHAWELTDFEITRGLNVGREFLLELGKQDEHAFPVRFWTRLDYPGWGYLFKERYPPEWDGADERTRYELISYYRSFGLMPAILTSLPSHVSNLHEALNTWLGSLYFLLQYPKDSSGFLPEEDEASRASLLITLDLVRWLADEYQQGTSLGRTFWMTMSTNTRRWIPAVVSKARDLLGTEIAIPPLEIEEE